MDYAAAYAAWQADPEAFWAAAAEGITWERRWDRVFDPAGGTFGRWFPGAALNTCANCLDRHVAAGRGEQAALIWDSPLSGHTDPVHLPRSSAIAPRGLPAPSPTAACGAATSS